MRSRQSAYRSVAGDFLDFEISENCDRLCTIIARLDVRLGGMLAYRPQEKEKAKETKTKKEKDKERE